MGIHDDKLLKKIAQWKGEDASRASEVGEQRAEIKDFLELTGWNKTALAWMRKLDKLDEDKRDDILRSFDDLRGTLDKHWNGQSTPDMFATAEAAAEEAEAPEPLADGETIDDDDDAPDPDDDEDGDPEIAAEADDFEAHLAQIDDKVVPFSAAG